MKSSHRTGSVQSFLELVAALDRSLGSGQLTFLTEGDTPALQSLWGSLPGALGLPQDPTTIPVKWSPSCKSYETPRANPSQSLEPLPQKGSWGPAGFFSPPLLLSPQLLTQVRNGVGPVACSVSGPWSGPQGRHPMLLSSQY